MYIKTSTRKIYKEMYKKKFVTLGSLNQIKDTKDVRIWRWWLCKAVSLESCSLTGWDSLCWAAKVKGEGVSPLYFKPKGGVSQRTIKSVTTFYWGDNGLISDFLFDLEHLEVETLKSRELLQQGKEKVAAVLGIDCPSF